MTRRQLPNPQLIIAFSIAILLLWFVATQIRLEDTWYVLQRLTATQLLFLILLNTLVLATMVIRWHLLLKAKGYSISLWSLFRYRLAAFGVTYLTPGPQFGGEPLQVYLVTQRYHVPLSASIAAVTMDKVLEMVANFGFLAGGLLLLLMRGILPNVVGYQGLLLALLLLTLPIALSFALWQGRMPVTTSLERLTTLSDIWQSSPPQWFRRTVELVQESELQTAQFFRHHPMTLFWTLLITLIGWGLMLVEFAYAAQSLGVPFTITQLIATLTAARIAFLLPMPAGLGTLETSLVLAFRLLDFDPAAGLSLSLLIRGRDTLLAVTGLWWGRTSLLPQKL